MSAQALAQPYSKATLRQDAALLAAVGVLLLMVMAALLAPWLAPANPFEQDLLNRLSVPVWMDGGNWSHPLGTDHLGRDYLSRLLYGMRVSVFIGAVVTFTSAIIGTGLGVLAGFFGGLVDRFVSLVLTVRLALPVVLVALAAVATVGPSMGVVVWVLAPLLWDRFAIVTRSATQQVVQMDYIPAARALGFSTAEVILREVLPNLRTSIAVVATMEFSQAIVLEAALSFLGLGIPPPTPSLGLMISEGKSNILFHPWLITVPGIVLLLLVLVTNVLGDRLGQRAGRLPVAAR